MIVTAVKALGTLHALPAMACLWSGLKALSLPDNSDISHARLRYVAVRMLLTALALAACAISAWQLPSIAWVFAVLSLAMYIPPPSLRTRAEGPATQRGSKVMSYVPATMASRVIGTLLLVLVTFWPSA